MDKILVSAIAAMSANGIIGTNNKLPWHLPEDLQFFRQKTKGHICIMGRKTFDSIGAKPLPHRMNIVVSRSASELEKQSRSVGTPNQRSSDIKAGELIFVSDVQKALEVALLQVNSFPEKWGHEIFICGGADIYRQLLPRTQRIYLTRIDREVSGDASFPELAAQEWKQVDRRDRTEPEKFSFLVYERNQT